MEIFSDAQSQLILQSVFGNRPKFELCRDFMVVQVTCKNEEDSIKNEGTKVATRLYADFFRRSRADNSIVNGVIWQKFELIQAFMHVLITCKNEEEQIKNEGPHLATSYITL